ncbi:hypothetical protein C9374_005644 [Naegleria lovaniensis]|uniref:Phospholipid-transporting ATPase n=1 Tax=Naegleria lovaniensis TaxID=51637 RepID=A0AA88KIP8_NAELO|nr:uncharacterized protein C9374_005644 [Naegleria lovaniensis]KAG2382442.1 hypothetical protein C9374_005644 [Naegleria lovaniensis]
MPQQHLALSDHQIKKHNPLDEREGTDHCTSHCSTSNIATADCNFGPPQDRIVQQDMLLTNFFDSKMLDVNNENTDVVTKHQTSATKQTSPLIAQPIEDSLHAVDEVIMEEDRVIKPSDRILVENSKEVEVMECSNSLTTISQVVKQKFNSIRERFSINPKLLFPTPMVGDFSDDEDDNSQFMKTSSQHPPNEKNNNMMEISVASQKSLEEAKENPEIQREKQFETIYLNNREKNRQTRKHKWPTNYVRTTKYTLITFLPQNLFEQFRKAINIYNLIAVIAVLIPDISPIFPPAAVLPLTFIVLLQMAKDAYEDFQRHRQDLKANNETCRVVRDGILQEIKVKQVEIGDFVCVSRDESFPADLLCVYSSRGDNLCYIETAHLDGESNLKIRRPVTKILFGGSKTEINNDSAAFAELNHNSASSEQQKFINSRLSEIKGKLKIEIANKNLDVFEGTASVQHEFSSTSTVPSEISKESHSNETSAIVKETLAMENLLLRGCTLKNTNFIYGIAIYVGKDTKILNNTKENRVKRNALEITINKILAILVVFQQVICAIVAGIHGSFQESYILRAFYLKPLIVNSTSDGKASFVSVMSNWATIFILLNLIVNEALVIGFELIKSFQSWSIENDKKIRFGTFKAEVRTASMNQALSKIDVIFSDKTGTLTQNEMKYSDSYVDGVYYSERSNPGMMRSYLMKSQSLSNATSAHNSMFENEDSLQHHNTQDSHSFFLREFLLCLSLNNSVMVELDQSSQQIITDKTSTSPKYVYHGSSSDEIALLEAATSNGFILTQRTGNGLVIEEMGVSKFYEIIATFAFTSERKRMSVLVKHPDGKYVCYVKGADSVMMKRSKMSDQSDTSNNHHGLQIALQKFSVHGLRTLVCARRELSQNEVEQWLEGYTKASLSTKHRDRLLMHCATEIEKDLQILGCTAIEDKLQEHVAESIDYLKKAGLNIWVLTGDKTETAINIAYSTHVLHRNKSIEIRIRDATSYSHVKAKLKEALGFLEKNKNKNFEYALIIDSKSLDLVLQKYEKPFLRLVGIVRSAVCCRLKPLQKSTIVKLIEKHLSMTALAIGDGVNDVAMIQAASIGVGIKGKEGSQASRAADYALPRFKNLVRLLAVHGRNCCVRNADFLHFSLYKNFMIIMPQFYFIFYSAYSGTLIFDSWEQFIYMALFCFFQPITSGSCEYDLPEEVILQHPEIYDTLKKKHNNLFSMSSIFRWGFESIYHCTIIYYGILWSYAADGDVMENNDMVHSSDFYHLGKLIMTCLMSVITLRYMIEVKTWNLQIFFSIFGSYLFYFLFSACYSPVADIFGETGSYFIFYETFVSVKATLVSVLVIVVAILPNLLYKALRLNFFPHDYQQLLVEYNSKNKNHHE